MQRNKVVLVDPNDVVLGEMDKVEAHIEGVLHRAFSVFIFNSKNEMLIHQRAADKYHGANLWTNACCSHPQLDEDIKESALQRLQFEMGIECELFESFSFIYKTPVENGFIEHEYDHVFVGMTDVEPIPNPEEVQSYKWVSMEDLRLDIKKSPEEFTYWFKLALPKVIAALKPLVR